ncbi:DUF1003 domain-containing protein [Haladaptatus sp. CMAA 1911]|uniref:DUF1003 domain-containing protein n=1 Tax=unclassified Haladaptatus TaxID=2622732 RepID=UPI003754896C
MERDSTETGYETVRCPVCGEEKPEGMMVPGELIRSSLVALIRREHPEWSRDSTVCYDDLSRYRLQRSREVLRRADEKLSENEEEVLDSLANRELITEDVLEEYDRQLTLGERMADRLSAFGGSWKFLFLFGVFIGMWILVNALALFGVQFDPYPFILLNLVLSLLAAIQAPVIMMSQNRQENLDRTHAEHDYRVNLKAELEVRQLHEKLDHLLVHRWQQLMELQEIQTELIEDVVEQSTRTKE